MQSAEKLGLLFTQKLPTNRSGTARNVPGTVWNAGTLFGTYLEFLEHFLEHFWNVPGTLLERTWNAGKLLEVFGTYLERKT